MNQNQNQKQEGTNAIVERNISEKVANRVNELVRNGRIDLPSNYSVGNAISSAWLVLQGVKDKNGKPVLESCTQPSIANALLDMAVMGLNPAKKQGYFIAYGNQLTWFTSYFGKCAVAKRLKGIEYEPVATIIYEGDEVELGHNELGEECILSHKTTWQSKAKGTRVGAYATVKQNGITRSAVMTKAEITEAWNKNPGQKRDHIDFEGEFMKRTVINRLVKMITQTSNDDDLLAETMISNEEKHYDFDGKAEAIADSEIKEIANTGEVVDIPLDAVEVETLGEVEQVVEFAEEPQPVNQPGTAKPTVARSRPF